MPEYARGQELVRQKSNTGRQLNLVREDGERPKLGEVLVRSGAIRSEQLQHALDQQKKLKLPVGQLLVRLNYLTDEAMRQALSLQLNVPFLDLDRVTIDPALSRIVNRSYARRHSLLPVARVGGTLTICMDDPTNHAAIEDLRGSTGRVITIVTATHEAIERAFERVYPERARTPAANLDVIPDDDGEKEQAKSKYIDDSRQIKNAEALVRQLLSMAIELRSSDIHLETLSDRLQVRFRIDGVLEEIDLGELQALCNDGSRQVVSRLKILGKLDIAERRRPQDGSFRLRVDRR
jgi:type IV pilus assembly protein PilB